VVIKVMAGTRKLYEYLRQWAEGDGPVRGTPASTQSEEERPGENAGLVGKDSGLPMGREGRTTMP
jgi:hypothetical protein